MAGRVSRVPLCKRSWSLCTCVSPALLCGGRGEGTGARRVLPRVPQGDPRRAIAGVPPPRRTPEHHQRQLLPGPGRGQLLPGPLHFLDQRPG
ncbi:hypothetical protein AB205_0219200 [Aquarana catesbeiana]|uniref:Uncharacterized protein n=1 Tax=Aquarana catesbeiana TaxID=8400 RepID=A0A2G9RVK4_AQUCT|nr:hypothetical protein AB205_0219200 [Aquarana catesbeiana]